MSHKSVHYLPGLDGWRGLAALWVVYAHNRHDMLSRGWMEVDSLWHHLALNAEMAIEIFFALSGFLITLNLLKEWKLSNTIGFRRFYLSRFFRLVPASAVYLFCLAMLALLQQISFDGGAVVSSLFLYRNYYPSKDWYTGHFWSLSVEEHFYLIWPVILYFGLKNKNFIQTISTFLAMVILWRLAAFEWGLISNGKQWLQVKSSTRTDFVMVYLLFGCLYAYLHHQAVLKKWVERYLRSFMMWPLFVGLVLISFSEWPYGFLIKAPLVPLLFILPCVFKNSFEGRLLEKKLFTELGKYSYGLYIWQQLFFVVRPEGDNWFSTVQTFPFSWLMVFVCAVASYHIIENPIRKWGRQKLI